jgi:hypothetical protein
VRKEEKNKRASATYTQDSRVIGNPRRLWLCVLLCLLVGDADVAHITATEDNVFIDIRRGRNLLRGVLAAALSAKRLHILECYRRCLGVDLMKGTDVAGE